MLLADQRGPMTEAQCDACVAWLQSMRAVPPCREVARLRGASVTEQAPRVAAELHLDKVGNRCVPSNLTRRRSPSPTRRFSHLRPASTLRCTMPLATLCCATRCAQSTVLSHVMLVQTFGSLPAHAARLAMFLKSLASAQDKLGERTSALRTRIALMARTCECSLVLCCFNARRGSAALQIGTRAEIMAAYDLENVSVNNQNQLSAIFVCCAWRGTPVDHLQARLVQKDGLSREAWAR